LRRSVVAVIVGSAFRLAATLAATLCEVARRTGSMSISAISQLCKRGSCTMSPTRFFMNTVEPAPIIAILGNAAT